MSLLFALGKCLVSVVILARVIVLYVPLYSGSCNSLVSVVVFWLV